MYVRALPLEPDGFSASVTLPKVGQKRLTHHGKLLVGAKCETRGRRGHVIYCPW